MSYYVRWETLHTEEVVVATLQQAIKEAEALEQNEKNKNVKIFKQEVVEVTKGEIAKATKDRTRTGTVASKPSQAPKKR